MLQKIKKLVQFIFFYGLLFIALSALEAQFKTYWPGKVVHVSTSSSKFLKKMTLKFKLFLDEKNKNLKSTNSVLTSYCNKILGKLDCFSVSNPICGTDIEYVGESIFKARAPLIMAIKSGAAGKYARESSLFQEIGLELHKALKEVYIGTAKSDLAQIGDFLNNPKKEKVIYTYGLIQETISHFDALAVTEYDFMVLCQCALFVLCFVD